MSPSNGLQNGGGGGGGNGLSYIEHQVSKFDTLAGVAIKYGVEVISSLCFFWVRTLNWFRHGKVGCFLYSWFWVM